MYNHLLFWKCLSAVFVVVIIFQHLIRGRHAPVHQAAYHLSSPPTSVPQNDKEWAYKWERDSNDHSLTTAQCDSAFPKLYHELDRAVRVWRERNHTIGPEDIEISWRRDAAFRVLVHDGQIRITEAHNTMNEAYRFRTMAVLHQIHRAVTGSAPGTIPTVEFSVTVDDMSLIPNPQDDTHTIWNFARRVIDKDQDRLWLVPDFNFWSSPPMSAFADMQRKAREHDSLVAEKKPTVIWRGVRWTNEFVRGALLKVTQGKSWADVAEVDWDNNTNILDMEEMCRSMFVVHTEGRSWSGRLKYLLNCNSVPIIHELDWTAHYYHLLVPNGPDQNYIPVKRDFSDLAKKVEWFLDHPTDLQRIADNSVRTFRERYTTPAAEACYWRRLLQSWSTVAWTPDLYENVTVDRDIQNIRERRMRGITFEEFA